jgi:RND family efflux transporter MFP subunit
LVINSKIVSDVTDKRFGILCYVCCTNPNNQHYAVFEHKSLKKKLMKPYMLILLVAALTIGCTNTGVKNSDEHAHDAKLQITAYNADFEVFAEADPFSEGNNSVILAHFTWLENFKPLDSGSVTVSLIVGENGIRQSLEKPTRTGIYAFTVKPEHAGIGRLVFSVKTEKGESQIIAEGIEVYTNKHNAGHAAEKAERVSVNSVAFTKEQSWKVDFATEYPGIESFGQVIKTTALIQPAQGNEQIVIARSAGVVLFSANKLIEGKEVNSGESLFSISGSGLIDNNIAVKYAEARSNFEKASADYERAKDLAKDKIVSEKDLLAARNNHETTKAVFDNMKKNTGESGQTIASPMQGFIKQVFVKNGAYVEAGQAVMVVSQNKTLAIIAELPQRYAPVMGTINSANIYSHNDKKTYSLEQLNGKILSYGKSANTDNYLIPVTLQIDNPGNFVPGSFIDIYLKTISNTKALTIPVPALLEEQGLYFVWVQITPELFEKREVHIGVSDGLQVEIIDGISENDRIVTRGAMLIKLAQATGTLDAHSGHVH